MSTFAAAEDYEERINQSWNELRQHRPAHIGEEGSSEDEAPQPKKSRKRKSAKKRKS